MLFDPNSAGGAGSSSSYRSLEFIAVILAGEAATSTSSNGASYLEAGGDDDDAAERTDTPQAGTSSNGLLPPILQQVEGKPRIDGLLKWIEEAGVSDAVILAPEYQHQGLTAYLRTRKSPNAKDVLPGETIAAPLQPMLRVDLQEWDEDNDTENQALRSWAEKSPYKHADLIILPPELLESFGNKSQPALPALASLLDRHRLDENLITTLLCEKAPVTSKKQKEAEAPPLIIAYDNRSSTLLDIRDLQQREEGEDEDISIRSSLLMQYPILSLSTKLQLSHIYICSRHVMQILSTFPELRYFEEQALRWICKAQWQKSLLKRGKEGDRPKEALPHSQLEALKTSSTRSSGRSKASSRMKVACIVQR